MYVTNYGNNTMETENKLIWVYKVRQCSRDH